MEATCKKRCAVILLDELVVHVVAIVNVLIRSSRSLLAIQPVGGGVIGLSACGCSARGILFLTLVYMEMAMLYLCMLDVEHNRVVSCNLVF